MGGASCVVAAAPSRRPAAPGVCPKTPPARLLPGSRRGTPSVRRPPPPGRDMPLEAGASPPGARGRSARRGAPDPSPPRKRTARLPLPPPGRRPPRAPAPASCSQGGPGAHAAPLHPQPASRAHRPHSRYDRHRPRLTVRRAPPSASAHRDDVATTHWSSHEGPTDWLPRRRLPRRPASGPAGRPHWLAAGVSLAAGDLRGPRPRANAFRAGRGGTQAVTPQPPGQTPAAGPGAGCPGTGGLRVRPPADALPSQEDVAAAPEDTRGEPADAGRKEGRRVGGATGGPPVTLHPIPSALPGVPRPEGGPEGGRRGRTPRPQAIAFRAGRGGTQALTPQPPGQSPAWQSPEEP